MLCLLCIQALDRFSSEALVPEGDDIGVVSGDQDRGGDEEQEERDAVFGEKLDQLERALDVPLRLVFLHNLHNLRARALELYQTILLRSGGSTGSSGGDEYAALVAAETFFRSSADSSRRAAADWDYTKVSSLAINKCFCSIYQARCMA